MGEGCLRGAGGDKASDGDAAEDGGDVDDRATLLEQGREGSPGQGVRGRDVEVEGLLEELGVGLEELLGHRATHVVHDDVEPSERLDGAAREGGDLVEVHRVRYDDVGTAAQIGHLLGDLLQLVFAAGRQDDVGTGFGKRKGGRSTDSASGTGDDGDLAVQAEHVQHHGVLLRGRGLGR